MTDKEVGELWSSLLVHHKNDATGWAGTMRQLIRKLVEERYCTSGKTFKEVLRSFGIKEEGWQ